MVGCDGAVFGTGVCGRPEPGIGVAGLFCATAARPAVIDIRTNIEMNASDAVGKRCIEFKGLRSLRFLIEL